MIRIGDPAHGIVAKTVHKTLPGGGGSRGGKGWGVKGIGDWKRDSDIRTQVKSLKIDIAERTRNCENLLLKITYLSIFPENQK